MAGPAYGGLIAPDEALSELADHGEHMARVVECRFFREARRSPAPG